MSFVYNYFIQKNVQKIGYISQRGRFLCCCEANTQEPSTCALTSSQLDAHRDGSAVPAARQQEKCLPRKVRASPGRFGAGASLRSPPRASSPSALLAKKESDPEERGGCDRWGRLLRKVPASPVRCGATSFALCTLRCAGQPAPLSHRGSPSWLLSVSVM